MAPCSSSARVQGRLFYSEGRIGEGSGKMETCKATASIKIKAAVKEWAPTVLEKEEDAAVPSSAATAA